LRSGFFTFSCLNNLAKINRRVISLWARILQRVPAARLVLGNASDEAVRKRLWQLFGDFGVLRDRVVLKPSLPLNEFLASHDEIDLALDPFPWNGGTTTHHCLHMGVPVVTLAGDLPAGRLGVATMMCAGLPEFVARNEDEYVEIAVRFASDGSNLSQIRRELRHRISADPRNDPRQITREIEAAFCGMWADRCA
jgi:predicted O-linked N-acetylglucosamine transferase (SPINDLY family)